MIVKRMMESLRRQDWTMVAIEFLLVVVGVLMGFQITKWANERESASLRRTATERLLEEAERDVAYLRQAVDFEQNIVSNLGLATNVVAADGAGEADRKRATEGLAKARAMVALAPPSSVYDDIVASGDLNKIGTVELRSSISRYQSTLSFEERMRQQLETALPQFQRLSAFTYRTDPTGTRPIQLDVDYPALARDKAARQSIALTAENHRILLMLRKRALKDSERMCLALGNELGRRCDLNLPPPTFD